MLCIKVRLKEAEKAKNELVAKELMNREYQAFRDDKFIYFPVKQKYKPAYASKDYEFVNKALKKHELPTCLKNALSCKLEKNELELLKRSMDIIGSIAIIEIPNELEKREKLIATEALKTNHNIKTILKKGKHEGVFRTQNLKYLAGEKTKEATYKENNIILKLDVEKVYFSPRLSNERNRIINQVKKNEDVLVMFSGCGPYTCAIARNTEAKQVIGVEINPVAHDYALKNILLNKLGNASAFLGDAKDVVPKLGRKFDRIIMPLPKSAADFLEVALSVAKKNAIINFYDFQKTGEFEQSAEKIKKACKKANRKCKILQIAKCGQSSPREYRICVDFEVL